LPHLHLEQVKMSGKLGGRLEVDAATFVTTGDLTGFDPGIELRRLRVSLGGDCILVLPVSYYLDLGYNSGGFYLDKAYLNFPAGRFLGNVQIGQFQPRMGLELITSSRDIAFMEPAAPLQALAPGVEAGIQIGRPVFNQRATWALGVFAPGAGSQDYGIASQDFGSLVGRVTWLPDYHPDSEVPAANRLLHLGLSANVLYSSSSTLHYQSRPESHIAPYVIDTGDIDANGAATAGLEAAWVNGPLSVQGEFLHSSIGAANGVGDLSFYGGYVYASWYLTGESRSYNPTTGAFNRLIPRNNFKFGANGWGAVELTCRFSYTDLSDGPVSGGRLSLLMAGVNWYLQPHVRWMFNSGMGRTAGGTEAGDLFIFQTRIGIDF
jgi:phosphate-selective porin OprO/OprP